MGCSLQVAQTPAQMAISTLGEIFPMTTPLELAVKRLAWELKTRKSVEVRTRAEIIAGRPDPQRPPNYDAIDDHYLETAIEALVGLDRGVSGQGGRPFYSSQLDYGLVFRGFKAGLYVEIQRSVDRV